MLVILWRVEQLVSATQHSMSAKVHQTVHHVCSQLTVRCVPLSGRCVLEDDGHEGLADGALPCLGHFPAHAAIGRHIAGGRRSGGKTLGVAGRQRGEGVGVLPHKVAHGACDELKAMGACSWRDKGEVASSTHLQNLR